MIIAAKKKTLQQMLKGLSRYYPSHRAPKTGTRPIIN